MLKEPFRREASKDTQPHQAISAAVYRSRVTSRLSVCVAEGSFSAPCRRPYQKNLVHQTCLLAIRSAGD